MHEGFGASAIAFTFEYEVKTLRTIRYAEPPRIEKKLDRCLALCISIKVQVHIFPQVM